MRIGVLSGGDGWHVRDLIRAANGLGHAAEPVDFRRIAAAVPNAPDDAVGSALRGAPARADAPPTASGPDTAPEEGERHGGRSLQQLDAVIVRTMPPA